MTDNFVNVWCRVIRRTEKAILIRADDDREVWLPRAALQFAEQAEPTTKILCLSLAQNIAYQKGLI
ncbi:MAG: hypothetical protein DCC73_14855 [Proteobacteria bacterium]|nr:MAG: hypothetical protein DCC73_14855 [Pseudomonadota bacterium]